MKLSNRFQIITGQTWAHIAMHLLVIAALVWGWKHKALVEVCSTWWWPMQRCLSPC